MKLRKYKRRAQLQPRDNPQDVQQNNDSNRPDSHPNEKSKKRKSKGENRKYDGKAVNKMDEVEKKVTSGATGEGRGASKRQKNNPAVAKVKKSSQKETSGGSEQKAEVSKGNPEKWQHGRKPDDAQRSKSFKESNTQPKKRKQQLDPIEFEKGEKNLKRRKRSNKNKDPQGRDIGDKLDMLIEQYRSKYSKQSSNKADGERQGSGQLRKWFQS